MGKQSACNVGNTGDMGSIPGLRSCPGGKGMATPPSPPPQHSCLENPVDKSRLVDYSPRGRRDTTEATERARTDWGWTLQMFFLC